MLHWTIWAGIIVGIVTVVLAFWITWKRIQEEGG